MGSCIKTYIIQFIYNEGNGWAFINAHSVNQAGQVFKVQTRYKDAKITGIKETKYYGEEMQLVYEGAVTTGNKTLYDLAVLNGFKGSLDEFLKSLVGPKGDKGNKGDKGDKGEPGDGYNKFYFSNTTLVIDSYNIKFEGTTLII